MKIQKIAELAGVSPSTVSRVFSHNPNISEATRQKVFAVAKEYMYHPRQGNKQRNVVIITPFAAENPVQCCVEMLLLALTRVLPQRGFRLEILPHDNLERLESIQFCAAAAIGAEPAEFRDWAQKFTAPLVIVDRKAEFRSEEVYVVRSDEEQGMRLALAELKAGHCRRIGCIVHGPTHTGNADLRMAAIRKVLKELALPVAPGLLHCARDEEYLELIGKMLQNGIDGLFCPGGAGGILCSYALSLFGKKIPQDVSLITSEQVFFSRYGIPPQTTISPDYQAMAESVAELIEARLAGEPCPREVIHSYLLLRRDSVQS